MPNNKMKYYLRRMNSWLFTRENLLAILFCLIILAILIFSADRAPQWIYQGF